MKSTSPTVSPSRDDEAMTQGTLQPIISSRIEFLVAALGSATEVAEHLRISRPLLRKWRTGTVMPTPAQLRLLITLDHVVARASLFIEGRAVIEWLNGSNSYLGGARPIDVLHVSGVRKVLDALDAGEQLAWGG